MILQKEKDVKILGNEKTVRLQKAIADAGLMSRRRAEALIEQGRVKVNGKVAVIGTKVDPRRDKIWVEGKRLSAAAVRLQYIMLHKPRGYITTMSDEQGRRSVAELIHDVDARLYPVGRLDRDSEGLLLMTNDGDFANALAHPAHHIPKTYRVTVRPHVTDEMLTQMTLGMVIDGQQSAPADVRVRQQQPGRVVLELTLYEGRNRQIRKMCEQLGLEVARLKRVSMGQLKLGMLPVGKWRSLDKEEVNKLLKAAKPKKKVSE